MINQVSETQIKPFTRYFKKILNLKNLDNIISFLILPVLILIIWHIVSTLQLFPRDLFPTLQSILIAFIKQIKNGQLAKDLSITTFKVFKGYSYAVILGLFFGVLMGLSQRFYKNFIIIFSGLRQIPELAWIPLLILFFGLGQTSSIVIISLASFFPILLNTTSGLKNTPTDYIEVGRLHRINKLNLFKKVYLPSALPSIFIGLRLSLGVAWSMVVIAEMIVSSTGIGHRINSARGSMQSDLLIVEMIVVGIVGSLMDVVLRKISTYFLRWQ